MSAQSQICNFDEWIVKSEIMNFKIENLNLFIQRGYVISNSNIFDT